MLGLPKPNPDAWRALDVRLLDLGAELTAALRFAGRHRCGDIDIDRLPPHFYAVRPQIAAAIERVRNRQPLMIRSVSF